MTDKRPAQETRWVWLDLEMTGLDVKRCHIIQIAVIITDTELQELASLSLVIHQPESRLTGMLPIVEEMHTSNGLLDKVRVSDVSLEQAETQALELIKRHVPPGQGVLAGNSIWMDRWFLMHHMQRIDAYLHHRMIDVSSLKVLCAQWYGVRGTPPDKASSHTALEDARASIAELRYLRDHCMRAPRS